MFDPSAAPRPRMSHRRPTRLDRFWFGACYYPEHWDEATRARDIERMREAGINIVRLAEFAWDLMEPREGYFDFSVFDDAIERLGRVEIKALLCTPTAAPPRWLTRAYPDVLRVDADGQQQAHGSRQHCCHMSPTLARYSREITERMATHYRDNPHVVGWQTDNEFHCHFSECHCVNCQRAFIEWCRARFDDNISHLNRTWGTRFWSQTYGGFDEIATPRSKPTYMNPAHQLDYFRFLSDGVTRFQREQVEILREKNRSWFITHNGIMSHIDYGGPFTEDLDFIGCDVYPMFTWSHGERLQENAYSLDRARAWSGNFVIPEHQSGPGGQPPYFHDMPEPGEVRLLSYSAIAHGADSLLYFRWRTARVGAEQYWCGVLDHDDVPRRRYHEIAQIGRELARVGPDVIGTSVYVDAAVASCDFSAEESHATYSLGLPHPIDIGAGIHAEFWQRGFAAGCIHPQDDLEAVKLYVIPHYALFDPRWVPNLERFVERGGVLLVGARCATRDLDNNVIAERLPGCLRELTGLTVEEYGKLNDVPGRSLEIEFGDQVVPAEHWYERLAPARDTEVVARYRGRPHLDGEPAVVRRALGEGKIFYFASYLTRRSLQALMPELAAASGLLPLWPNCPRGVSVVRREARGKRIWFFLNSSAAPVTLPSVPAGQDLLGQHSSRGPCELGGYGVLVIRE